MHRTLPLTLTRVVTAALGQDWGDMKYLARQMAALADIFTILLLYLIVTRLYGRRIALLAALFSSLAVMQIQQSHFFTTDLFTNLFMFLAIVFAVEIILWKEKNTDDEPD